MEDPKVGGFLPEGAHRVVLLSPYKDRAFVVAMQVEIEVTKSSELALVQLILPALGARDGERGWHGHRLPRNIRKFLC